MSDYGHELAFGAFLTPSSQRPADVVDLARLADEAGLDLVTFQDHPYQPAFLDTWTLMSYVAARTRNVRLAGNVLNLPLRNPAVLARSVASLDLLSGGRAELGIGAGGFTEAIAAMGGRRLAPGQAVDALAEAIGVIRQIWDVTARGGVRAEGTYYQVAGAKRGPAPAHPVSIWVGAYKPRMLRLTGRLADGWLPSLGYIEPGQLAQANAIIDEAAAEAGREPGAVRRLLNVSGAFEPAASGLLRGPAAHWAEQLADLALTAGISTFILGSDDPRAISTFAAEVAPAVRELVAAERAGAAAERAGAAAEPATSRAATSRAATSRAATSRAGTSRAGTSRAGTSRAGTGGAGTGGAGTGGAGTGGAGTGGAGGPTVTLAGRVPEQSGQPEVAKPAAEPGQRSRGQTAQPTAEPDRAGPVPGQPGRPGASAEALAELGVAPTPDDGTRLSSQRLWDETARPTRTAAAPTGGYTRSGRAASAELVAVHDMLREELATVRDLILQVQKGTIDAGRARSEINEMTMRQNNWTLGAYCESYCRVVTQHHGLEDAAVFPRLRARERELSPVLDRLQEEHRVIHQVLDSVDRALVAFISSPGDLRELQEAADLLSDTLLSHLAYEERELLEPLARYGF